MATAAAFVAAMGIPSAVMGLIVWLWKRSIEKKDAEKEQERLKQEQARATREANTEKLMLMIMQTSRATNILAEATAKAVQRIPDAHCNGDMTAALEQAAKIQRDEQQFLIDNGIKHIFGE